MRKGSFEEENSSGGQKVYRLRWESSKKYVLTPKEVMSGLFIRYLISRGKLSEYDGSPDQVASEMID